MSTSGIASRSGWGPAWPGRPTLVWAAGTAALVGACAAFVAATHMRPEFDTFGWLDWGRTTIHGRLETGAAPSWKPLTFLFTLPFALAGANAQMWLWMITATSAAAAGAVFAGRIAYRLTGPAPGRPWAPWAAAAFAVAGVLGLDGFSHLVLIANSDPMVATLALAAIDAQLCRRPGLALGLLVLVAYGRPEGWAFVALAAAARWRAEPSTRVPVAIAVLSVPAAWFIVPALTSHSWFSAGDLALGSPNVIHGDRLLGVLNRLRDLLPVAVQAAVVLAAGLAVRRRDRVALGLVGAAALWVAIEICFAYHGWSAVPRYLIEPAAVLATLAGTGVGWVLTWRPRGAGAGWPAWAGPVLVAALAVALVPTARARARVAHGEIDDAHRNARRLSGLEAAITADGGPERILACGRPVTALVYQSEVAWTLDVPVGEVDFDTAAERASGRPIVVFSSEDDGDGDAWRLVAVHVPAALRARCAKLTSP